MENRIVQALTEATEGRVKFTVIDLPRDHPYREDLWRLNLLNTESVKRLWDAYDGCNCPLGYSGEAIHLELNRRGHGHYCAV